MSARGFCIRAERGSSSYCRGAVAAAADTMHRLGWGGVQYGERAREEWACKTGKMAR